jgi:uncharacterized membrane protein
VLSNHIWHLRRSLRKIWVRVVSFAILVVISAVLSQTVSDYMPEIAALQLGADAVEQILGVLASSMLAVTTFSLSIAVSAFAAAAGSATPRSTALLQEDRTTQNVLATFLGAFLFGLLGLIALKAELYDASGRVVLFIVTCVVVLLVIVALIRWINHLMSFGRMGNTLDRVEQAATKALEQRLANRFLGGRPLLGGVPEGCAAVSATSTGYVEHLNMELLNHCADELDAQVYVMQLPGAFVPVRTPLVMVQGDVTLDDKLIQNLQQAFSVGRERVFDADPRFGVIVLNEIASRALSPAVNDPGTAISVLGRLVRVLSHWKCCGGDDVIYPNVHVPPITPVDVLVDAFRPIARDGAGMVEVQIRLQKSLAALVRAVPGAFDVVAVEMSRYALARAQAAGLAEAELAELRRLGEQLEIAPHQSPAAIV